jgi:hypothetical protein
MRRRIALQSTSCEMFQDDDDFLSRKLWECAQLARPYAGVLASL